MRTLRTSLIQHWGRTHSPGHTSVQWTENQMSHGKLYSSLLVATDSQTTAKNCWYVSIESIWLHHWIWQRCWKEASQELLSKWCSSCNDPLEGSGTCRTTSISGSVPLQAWKVGSCTKVRALCVHVWKNADTDYPEFVCRHRIWRCLNRHLINGRARGCIPRRGLRRPKFWIIIHKK